MKIYTDEQLLTQAKSLDSFKGWPTKPFGIGVRSAADLPDRFDDKLYLFDGTAGGADPKFLQVYRDFTTNAGLSGLRYPQNPKGTAVLKANEWYYECWQHGMHRGKVRAWVQCEPLPVWRDSDRDSKNTEKGTLDKGLFGINIHPSNYNSAATTIRQFIGGWSLGCQVFGNRQGFNDFMQRTADNKRLTYVLLREF